MKLMQYLTYSCAKLAWKWRSVQNNNNRNDFLKPVGGSDNINNGGRASFSAAWGIRCSMFMDDRENRHLQIQLGNKTVYYTHPTPSAFGF
jgi:hypothetical protein